MSEKWEVKKSNVTGDYIVMDSRDQFTPVAKTELNGIAQRIAALPELEADYKEVVEALKFLTEFAIAKLDDRSRQSEIKAIVDAKAAIAKAEVK